MFFVPVSGGLELLLGGEGQKDDDMILVLHLDLLVLELRPLPLIDRFPASSARPLTPRSGTGSPTPPSRQIFPVIDVSFSFRPGLLCPLMCPLEWRRHPPGSFATRGDAPPNTADFIRT